MNDFILPIRTGEQPIVGKESPQLQYSQTTPEDIKKKLKLWMFSKFPYTKENDTVISIPSARAMWLDEKYSEAHKDAFMPPKGSREIKYSREYCHIHEDGSFHLIVDDKIKEEILFKKWGLLPPWYEKGVKEMFIYAVRDSNELTIIKKIIIESYRYATGDFKTNIPM